MGKEKEYKRPGLTEGEYKIVTTIFGEEFSNFLKKMQEEKQIYLKPFQKISLALAATLMHPQNSLKIDEKTGKYIKFSNFLLKRKYKYYIMIIVKYFFNYAASAKILSNSFNFFS